jgi:hypothetical protein
MKCREYAMRAERLMMLAYTSDASPRPRAYRPMVVVMKMVENAAIHLQLSGE